MNGGQCAHVIACTVSRGLLDSKCPITSRKCCTWYEPEIDRDALLALADEMEEFGNLPVKHPGVRVLQNDDFSRELGYARRIREAVGA